MLPNSISMRLKTICLVIAGLCLIACVLLIKHPHAKNSEHVIADFSQKTVGAAPVLSPTGGSRPSNTQQSKIRHRASEFSADEKTKFLSDFGLRCKPAIDSWFKAYNGHIPFDLNAVTPEKLVERIGINASFGEYVFVVDGITLGVRDSKGIVQVDYLNDPIQTQKMAMLPNGAEPPIAEMPVNRPEITQMVAADSGTQFPPNEIRMTPSGFSGGLNGGTLVQIGGDPRNGASWKFDMVFGPDGKLAYYLRVP